MHYEIVNCSSQIVMSSPSTFWMIIPLCLGGSKGWSGSSKSTVYGQPRGSMCSVKISTTPLNKLTATISSSSFHCQTLLIKSHNFKSLLSCIDTFTTSMRPSAASNLRGAWPIPCHWQYLFKKGLGQLEAIGSNTSDQPWAISKSSVVSGYRPTPRHW